MKTFGGHLGKDKIISKLRKIKPEYVDELLIKCEFPIEFVSYGSFRIVWRVISTQYVIKMPLEGDYGYESGLIHSGAEINAYNRIMKVERYRPLRKWMPEFFYTDKPRGLILTGYYRQIVDKKGKYDLEINEIEKLCQRWGFKDDRDADLCIAKRDNFGVDSKGKLRILDLGCFTKGDII